MEAQHLFVSILWFYSPNPVALHIEHSLQKLTSANRSKRAKSSFRIFTRSWAQYVDEMAVNPTMSAYKMLKGNTRKRERKFTWFSIMMARKLLKRIKRNLMERWFISFLLGKTTFCSQRLLVKRQKFTFYRSLADVFFISCGHPIRERDWVSSKFIEKNISEGDGIWTLIEHQQKKGNAESFHLCKSWRRKSSS